MESKPDRAWLSAIAPGAALPELRLYPSEVQLFRFSAVSWNAHRIHYDSAYAHSEGYRAPLVQSQLLGSLLSRVVTDWMGIHGQLTRFSWRNRAPAYVGELLVARAVVRQVDRPAGVAELDLTVHNGAGALLVQGTACITARANDIHNEMETP
jgi:hydroxyacyl-ACP dehydratase HTD2-like protein with hotdog domain